MYFLQYFCSCEPGPIIQPWWHDWWRRLRPFGWCAPGMWFLLRNGGRNLRTLASVCVKQLCKTGLHLAPQSGKNPGISFPTAKRTVSAKTSKLGQGKCWTSNPMMPKPFHGSCSTLVGFERFWGRGNFYGARRAFALLWLPLVVCLADLSSPVWKHFLLRNKKSSDGSKEWHQCSQCMFCNGQKPQSMESVGDWQELMVEEQNL